MTRPARRPPRPTLIVPGLLLATLAAIAPPPARAAPAAAPGAKAAVMPYQRYALDVPNTKMAFTVALNGWPIIQSAGGPDGFFSSTLVGDSVADGDNAVTLHVAAPPHGKSPRSNVLDQFRVNIRAAGGPAFSFAWEPGDPRHTPPFTVVGHFRAHLPGGPWAWQAAPRVTLDAQAEAGIVAHMRRLFGALDTKNVAETCALFLLRNREDGLARGMTAAEADATQPADWANFFKDPQWHLTPVEYAHLRYSLLAEGRVVHVSRADGYRPLEVAKASEDGSHVAWDVFVCLVNGQWTLIR